MRLNLMSIVRWDLSLNNGAHSPVQRKNSSIPARNVEEHYCASMFIIHVRADKSATEILWAHIRTHARACSCPSRVLQ